MIKGRAATVARARQLRRAMSWPEVVLWNRLRTRPAGLKFRRQHPAGPYVLDFYCHDARLAIEIDGAAHDMGDRPGRDATRERWLEAQGLAVLRIAAAGVRADSDGVAEGIVAYCLQRVPLHRPSGGPPPRSGEE